MTVLKSLDLKGNKQSFAGWISNMSPCDTPFTSMTRKEGLSQTQYSWQMDELDAPTHPGFDEGSDAAFRIIDPTDVVHNFTSVIRKVANVSDTVAAIGTHGRNAEIAYQMGKAGKELKRDMEYMYLRNGMGNIGSDGIASKFSGFYPLCAPPGYTNPITGAHTTIQIDVADLDGPWFKASDLFDVTYNLYLAGSKANKIMYHPRHASTFSDFIGSNVNTPLSYRMFSGIEDKFNLKISKIRDPLSQTYDLIPNRFMPEDKIYFFNEDDWTQMILRQPSASPLSKQGSSERFMIEAEVGLRHRHINASGVLEMSASKVKITVTNKPTTIAWGLDELSHASVKITERSSGANVPDGTDVHWTSSNPLVLSVPNVSTPTRFGNAEITVNPLKAGFSVVTVTSAGATTSFRVNVVDPDIRLTLSSPMTEVGKKVLAIASVHRADGSLVGNGVPVNFTFNPDTLVTYPDGPAAGTQNGIANKELTAVGLGLLEVRARVGSVWSNRISLGIVDKVELLTMEITQKTLAAGINDSVAMDLIVIDGDGAGISGKNISLTSSDKAVIDFTHDEVTTDAHGVVIVALAAKKIGKTTITATFGDQSLDADVVVTPPNIVLSGPAHFTLNQGFNMSATVTRSDGSNPGTGVEVNFTSIPAFIPAVAPVGTNAQGIAIASYVPTGNSDLEITASVNGYRSNEIVVTETMVLAGQDD